MSSSQIPPTAFDQYWYAQQRWEGERAFRQELHDEIKAECVSHGYMTLETRDRIKLSFERSIKNENYHQERSLGRKLVYILTGEVDADTRKMDREKILQKEYWVFREALLRSLCSTLGETKDTHQRIPTWAELMYGQRPVIPETGWGEGSPEVSSALTLQSSTQKDLLPRSSCSESMLTKRANEGEPEQMRGDPSSRRSSRSSQASTLFDKRD